MVDLAQPSFAGGELSPSLYSRVDIARFQNSLRTAKNFIVRPYGGVVNRPGSQFVGEALDFSTGALNSNRKVRLIPFQVSASIAYMLEFSHESIRFIANGEYLKVPTAEPWLIGATYFYTGLTLYNGVVYRSLQGSNIGHQPDISPEWWLPNPDVMVLSPWTENQIWDIHYTQSADTLFLAHPETLPVRLRRFSATDFDLGSFVENDGPFQDINPDEGITVTASSTAAGAVTLTASDPIFTPEMIPSLFYLEQQDASPIKPWYAGERGIGVGDLRRSDGKIYKAVTVPTLAAEEWAETGSWRPIHEKGRAWDGGGEDDSRNNTLQQWYVGIEWEYQNSGFGVVALTSYVSPTEVAGVASKAMPDDLLNGTNVFAFGAWSPDAGYPSEVEFYADRLVFANTRKQPQTLWMSQSSDYSNFGTSSPVVDSDAITATLNARQLNSINELVALNALLLLTAGGEWRTSTGASEVLAPSTVGFSPQSYNGASKLPALVIGNSALFVQDRGYVVRDIGYQFDVDGFTGNDLTVFSSHLTEGKPIKDWAYQKIPFSVVWLAREDGVLLSMTYMREQEIIGWTPMEVDGLVESVAVIPEGGEDSLYLVVRRLINGQQRRYVERLSSRLVAEQDVRAGVFLDAHLTYDGRNKTGNVVTVSGDSFLVGETVTMTTGSAAFDPGMVGDVLIMGYMAEANARIRIDAFASDTEVQGEILTPLPAQYLSTTDWAIARNVFSGLDHLEGETVGILSDGFVPDQEVVTGGQIELQDHGAWVHVGLPYTSDFETLDINIQGQQSIRLASKNIKEAGIILQNTRGLSYGPSFDNLDEEEPRQNEPYVAPPALKNELREVRPASKWGNSSRFCIRQKYPLPMSILGVILDTKISG